MAEVSKKAETLVVSEGPPGLVKGYLEDLCNVDIVVNSAPNSMKLTESGSISLAILTRAGPGIQIECDNEYPNGIGYGEIGVTGGHKLPYSVVFHCSVQDINKENCFTVTADLIRRCLLKADGKQIKKNNGDCEAAKTIAFPLLGTGGKNFPAEICKVFYRTILSFLLGPTKSLKNVYIIVTPKDKDLIKVIEDLKPFPEIESSTYEICYPYLWKKSDINLDVINLPHDSEEYEELREEFANEIPYNVKLISIERIQNKELYRSYLMAKCQYSMLSKEPEKKLWFPCDNNNISELYTSGLDDKYLRASKCGTGYLFCTTSFLADEMATDVMPRKMLYASVGVGRKPIVGTTQNDKNNLPVRCYSTVDCHGEPTMYVIYNEKLFYPNYIFTYQKK